MIRRRVLTAGVLLIVGAPTTARAEDIAVEDDPLEAQAAALDDAHARAGVHFALEAGIDALYAPDLPSFPGSRAAVGDVLVFTANESLVVAGASFRLGAAVGLSEHLDLRLGAGAMLGGQTIGEVVGPFTAYPHLFAGFTWHPSDAYLAEVGLAGGVVVFQEGAGLKYPDNPLGGLFGELAPVGWAFGPRHALSLKLTQGLGAIITGAYEPCSGAIGACVSMAGGPGAVHFAGHTMLTFGGVVL